MKLLLAVVLLLSVVACKKSDGGDESGSSGKSDKASVEPGGCKYIAKKDVESIAGHSMKKPKTDETDECTFEGKDDDTTKVVITVVEYSDTAWTSCSGGKVQNLGDKAVSKAGTTCVKQGKQLLMVNATVSADDDENDGVSRKVAKKVVAKLE